MDPKNIVIVGPTSSGKTNLALAIASNRNLPVFNCDSVQIYEDLDYLSNKPEITATILHDDEKVSTIAGINLFAYTQYSNFTFHVIRYKAGILTVNRELDHLEFFKWGIRTGLLPETLLPAREIEHFLFDIKEPMEQYSSAQFCTDVSRISGKFAFDSKILVGGTVYYAYHFLFGTDFQTEAVISVEKQVDDPVRFLAEHDPQALDLLDIHNIQRLQKAAVYIQQTGKKFSEQYLKPTHRNDDFLLIAIIPTEREVYVRKLEQIVRKRLDTRAVNEIRNLKSKYSETILPWLEKISYEYNAAVKLEGLLNNDIDLQHAEIERMPEYKPIIDWLVIKERQYSKRQVTFIRKLLKDLV